LLQQSGAPLAWQDKLISGATCQALVAAVRSSISHAGNVVDDIAKAKLEQLAASLEQAAAGVVAPFVWADGPLVEAMKN
ncbi:hypothetical protein, partial [Klebsiella aerogenes]|uniref:hypothetical protein n=1 Tax=Klebsiella aerogenes TaxID=548 RepID=UPI001CC53EEE